MSREQLAHVIADFFCRLSPEELAIVRDPEFQEEVDEIVARERGAAE